MSAILNTLKSTPIFQLAMSASSEGEGSLKHQLQLASKADIALIKRALPELRGKYADKLEVEKGKAYSAFAFNDAEIEAATKELSSFTVVQRIIDDRCKELGGYKACEEALARSLALEQEKSAIEAQKKQLADLIAKRENPKNDQGVLLKKSEKRRAQRKIQREIIQFLKDRRTKEEMIPDKVSKKAAVKQTKKDLKEQYKLHLEYYRKELKKLEAEKEKRIEKDEDFDTAKLDKKIADVKDRIKTVKKSVNKYSTKNQTKSHKHSSSSSSSSDSTTSSSD